MIQGDVGIDRLLPSLISFIKIQPSVLLIRLLLYLLTTMWTKYTFHCCVPPSTRNWLSAPLHDSDVLILDLFKVHLRGVAEGGA